MLIRCAVITLSIKGINQVGLPVESVVTFAPDKLVAQDSCHGPSMGLSRIYMIIKLRTDDVHHRESADAGQGVK